MRILVVEDEQKVASFIRRGLEAEHHHVDVAHDGDAGLARALDEDYDLVILDVMLPRRDGISVLRELRARRRAVPVLLLTARASVADKVAGLDYGPDHYLTNPFALPHLLPPRPGAGAPPALAVAALPLDPAPRQVTRAGRTIELTAREHALLEYFLRNPGRVLSRAMIAQHVWGVSFDTFTNVIDVYVNYLRRK